MITCAPRACVPMRGWRLTRWLLRAVGHLVRAGAAVHRRWRGDSRRILDRLINAQKQSAELRVAYKQGNQHALVVAVTIRGFDVYFGIPGGGGEEMFKSSYHETGQSHTKVAGGKKRIIDSPRRPVKDFRGVENTWQAAPFPEDLDWRYRPQSDKATRRTLIVELDALDGVVPTVDIWMIEKGAVTHLLDVMQGYRNDDSLEVINFKTIDWTQPWLHAVAHKPTAAVLDSMRQHLADSGIPLDGRIGGFVRGGPPTGKRVKVWPEPEEVTELPLPWTR